MSGSRIDLEQTSLCKFKSTVSDQLSGRLGAHEQESGQDDGRDASNSNSRAPSFAFDVSEASTNCGCNQLSKSNAHVVEGDHSSSVAHWRDLGDEKRADHGC